MRELLYETSTDTKISVSVKDGMYTLLTSRLKSSDLDVLKINKNELFTNEQLYILDSVKSGTSVRTDSKGIYFELLKPLLSDVLSIGHTYVKTESALLVREFAQELTVPINGLTLAIIGGDTTINEFVNGFRGESSGKVKIVVIPAGTGNALALSLGISDYEDALRLLFGKNASEIPLNMFQVSFPEGSSYLHSDGSQTPVIGPILFLVVTSWAFHASLVADSDQSELRKQGLERFKIAALQNLEWRQEYAGVIRVSPNGSNHGDFVLNREGPFAYLAITPAQKFEPSFEILPKGDVHDSSLFVIGFNTEDGNDYIMDVMKEVYDGGKHVYDNRVFYDRVHKNQKIKLEVWNNPTMRNRRFCVDGAIVVVPNTLLEVNVEYYGTYINGCQITVLSESSRKERKK